METNQPLLGLSPAMARVRADIETAARSTAKVLITGETGVGKEVVASLIYRASARAGRQFASLNCAGIPETLLETELFGHVRGSFTDAQRDRAGLLETVHGGTLFLDEVGEMSLRMQAILLRFLETGEVQRVGSANGSRRVDVRVITATNRHLPDRIAAGQFREDLYYRLNVLQISIPPLRERPEDVPVLFEHYLKMFSDVHHVQTPAVDPDVITHLEAYRWPGNVRQLRNVIERLVIRGSAGPVGLSDLPPEIIARPRDVHDHEAHDRSPDVLLADLTHGRESFWTGIYQPFIDRDLSRAQVRRVLTLAYRAAEGNHDDLLRRLGVAPGDASRFEEFALQYRCLPPEAHPPMPAHAGPLGRADRRRHVAS
jgi:DNA-binding NtrC family response regulator